MTESKLTTCGEVQAELATWIYGEADAQLAAAIRAHLQACTACREAEQGIRRTVKLLDTWTPGSLPACSPDSSAMAQRAVPRPRASRTWRPVALGSAAAIVLFFGLSLLGAGLRVERGALTLTFGTPSARALQTPSDPAIGQLVNQALDARFAALLNVLSDDLAHIEQRGEQRRLLLAKAIDVRRERDLLQQQTAFSAFYENQAALTRQALLDLVQHIDGGSAPLTEWQTAPDQPPMIRVGPNHVPVPQNTRRTHGT